MIKPSEVTPDMVRAVLARLKEDEPCGATVLRFVELPGSSLHKCCKKVGHPGRHSDGERAWS